MNRIEWGKPRSLPSYAEEIRTKLARLEVLPGDLVVVRAAGSGMDPEQRGALTADLRAALDEIGRGDVVPLVMDHELTLEIVRGAR